MDRGSKILGALDRGVQVSGGSDNGTGSSIAIIGFAIKAIYVYPSYVHVHMYNA